MEDNTVNFSYCKYLDLMETMIESILSSLDYSDIQKSFELNNKSVAKKQIFGYTEQLKNFLRNELQKKFMEICKEMNFPDFLQKSFEIHKKKQILKDFNIVSNDLLKMSPQAYVDLLLSINKKIQKVNEQFDIKNNDLSTINFQEESTNP